MTRSTRFCVTLDVERDYGKGWETPTTRTFRSVVEALPQRFEPLCKAHGTRPTYLVSAEAMLDLDAAAALRSLTDCELGAHLHAEYLPPGPRPAQWSDPSLRVRAMQRDLAPEDERERLSTLTRLFEQQFGKRPTSFRAGRFGAGPRTGAFLKELGYVVDSSATPLVAWPGNDGTDGPDWRNVPSTPWRAHRSGDLRLAGDSPLFEIPVTIVEAARIGRAGKDPTWLRPWYSDRATMLAILEAAARDEDRGMPWRTLCMMFHSMELVAGASPYAQTESEVDRVLSDLDAVFARARSLGFVQATLTEAADALARDDDDAVRSRATRIDPAAWNGDRARWRAFSESVDPAPTLAAHAVQPWFLYSIEQRHERWDNCLGYGWICENAILDVGCGPGWLAAALTEAGHTVVGVDIAEADGVRDRMSRFVQADLSHGIPDEVGDDFDLAIGADVIEHLADPAELLRDMAARVHAHGSVIASVPNISHWYPRFRIAASRFDYDQRGVLDATHLRFFTRRRFLRVAEEAGLERVAHRHTGLPLDALGLGDHALVAGTVGRADRLLVKWWPTMFAYQFVYEFRPWRGGALRNDAR